MNENTHVPNHQQPLRAAEAAPQTAVKLGEDCSFRNRRFIALYSVGIPLRHLSTWSRSESCEFRSPAAYGTARVRILSAIRQDGAANRGRLFFGYFLLATQKKVTSRRAAPGKSNVNETSYDKPRNTLINEAISH